METARAAPTHRSAGQANPRLVSVDFYSAYAQGFARVAACTLPVTVADPAANAARGARRRRARATTTHVAVAVFPELCLSGYAIDDLFLQDTLLEACARRSPRSSRRAPT